MNQTGITIRLSVMMFLQFFIWGGWFVTLGTFLGNNLGATGAETGMAFSTQSWGAIIAPFFIGLIADRYFNAEKILGTLHLFGALLMYFMSQATSFEVFYPLVFGYMVAYMPTLALVNSVSFFPFSKLVACFCNKCFNLILNSVPSLTSISFTVSPLPKSLIIST